MIYLSSHSLYYVCLSLKDTGSHAFGTQLILCLHAPYVGPFRHGGVVYGPLSARQRHLFASFGTTASSICFCQQDGVVYMPLSARRHRIYASFGTTVSSICLSQHDSVVTMPLSASFMGLFRHDGVVDMPLSARLILTCRNIYTYLPCGCTQVIVCLLPLRPQNKASLLVYSTILVNITRILHIRRFKFGFVSTLINTHVDSIPY